MRLPFVAVNWVACLHRLEVKHIAVALLGYDCSSSAEARGEDGLAHIGVGGENLVGLKCSRRQEWSGHFQFFNKKKEKLEKLLPQLFCEQFSADSV